MNENEPSILVPRDKCPVAQLIEALCRDTVHHFLDWKVVDGSHETSPAFYLDGKCRLFLSRKEAEEGKDHYELSSEDDSGSLTRVSCEITALTEPSALRKLYYFVEQEVSCTKPNTLFDQFNAYTKESQEREFLRRIRARSADSEDNHIGVKKLFEMCHEDMVVRMYLKLLTLERDGPLSQAEQERWEAIVSSTITILRETVYEPSKHLFSFKFPTMTARGFDGENGHVRLNSSLHQLAGCRCAFAHELDPAFGYYLTHLDSITPKEYDRLYDVVNRTCALFLHAVLAGF